jgi:hypothetical protein
VREFVLINAEQNLKEQQGKADRVRGRAISIIRKFIWEDNMSLMVWTIQVLAYKVIKQLRTPLLYCTIPALRKGNLSTQTILASLSSCREAVLLSVRSI